MSDIESTNVSADDVSAISISADDVSAGNVSATAGLSAHSLNIKPSLTGYSTKQLYCSSETESQNLRIWNPTHSSYPTKTSAIQMMAGNSADGSGSFGSYPVSVELSTTSGQTSGGSGLVTINGGTKLFSVNLRGTKSGDTYTLNTSDGVAVTNSTRDSKKLIKVTKPFSVMSFHDLTMGQVMFYFDSSIPEGTTITLFNHENSGSGQWILTNGTPTQVHLTSGRMYVLRLGGTFTYSGVTGRIVYEAGTSNVLTQP